MKIFINLIGVLLSLGSAIAALKSYSEWRGRMRDGLFFFTLGFAFLSTGFLWKIFVSSSDSSMDLIFFSMGVAFLALGAKRFFSINKVIV